MVTGDRRNEGNFLQRFVAGSCRAIRSPRRLRRFGRMLVGLMLVFTAAGCSVLIASGNLVAFMATLVVTTPVSDTEKVPEVEFQVHGRWCGPGRPTEEERSSGMDLSPVDLLDSACRKHDLCYEAHGGEPACRCNEEFIWRVKNLQYNVPDLPEDALAKTFFILGWFESAPCAAETSEHDVIERNNPQARDATPSASRSRLP
jgi:hypothetical protein